MKSSISRSAAWLIRPDLDPSWHTISERAIDPTADLAALVAPAGLAHMLSGATRWGRNNSIGTSIRPTFDMSGGPKGAKRPLGRPLDGEVRRQPADWTDRETDHASA